MGDPNILRFDLNQIKNILDSISYMYNSQSECQLGLNTPVTLVRTGTYILVYIGPWYKALKHTGVAIPGGGGGG